MKYSRDHTNRPNNIVLSLLPMSIKMLYFKFNQRTIMSSRKCNLRRLIVSDIIMIELNLKQKERYYDRSQLENISRQNVMLFLLLNRILLFQSQISNTCRKVYLASSTHAWVAKLEFSSQEKLNKLSFFLLYVF